MSCRCCAVTLICQLNQRFRSYAPEYRLCIRLIRDLNRICVVFNFKKDLSKVTQHLAKKAGGIFGFMKHLLPKQPR